MKYNKNNPLKVVTLCSGYDSQCMALDRLKEQNPDFDYELVAWSEIDKPAIMTHNAVYPQYADRNLGDMTKIDWTKLESGVDLLTYSTPCQSISSAGKQMGITEDSGTRSSILWYTRNAIKTLKPKFLLQENVKALVSDKFMPEFDKWRKELESYGYVNFYQVLNAKDYGVPQNRERVFMVSILVEDGMVQNFRFPTVKALDRRVKDIMEDNVAESLYLDENKLREYVSLMDKNKLNAQGWELLNVNTKTD